MVRIKERYLLVNFLFPLGSSRQPSTSLPDVVVLHQPTPNDLNPRALVNAIANQVSSLFGDFGAGAIEGNLMVKYLSKATSSCILKVKRSHYRLVWAALATMTHLPLKNGAGKHCVFQVVRVSGTIRKAEQGAVLQARRLVLSARATQDGSSSAIQPPTLSPALDGLSDVEDEDDDDNANDYEGHYWP